MITHARFTHYGRMKLMDTTVADVSRKAYRVFSDRANMGLPYMDRAEAAYKIIDESVFGVGEPQTVSKYLSIALALIQLIGEYNVRLSLRFRFDAADRLKQLPAWLKLKPTPVLSQPLLICWKRYCSLSKLTTKTTAMGRWV